MAGKLILSVAALQLFYLDAYPAYAQRSSDGLFEIGHAVESKFQNVTDIIEFDLGITQVYQQDVHGGISTSEKSGRYTSSYDLELSTDSRKLFDIERWSFYVHLEGGWPSEQGIDPSAVGSYFGVNTDAFGSVVMSLSEIWVEYKLAGDSLLLRAGKIDLTGGFECHDCPVAFDAGMYANDETTQFLNGALVNNPTIPFPDYSAGAAVYYSPAESWYVSAAVADAADVEDKGLFLICETGVIAGLDSAGGTMFGAYKLGAWHIKNYGGDSSNIERWHDSGFYFGFDQQVYKENSDSDDSQGLGIFGRYGSSKARVGDVVDFYSAGLQYQGLVTGRDEDVLGVGFAYGVFGDPVVQGLVSTNEQAIELYYNASVNTYLQISSGVQYIANPGGGNAADATIFGIRAQVFF